MIRAAGVVMNYPQPRRYRDFVLRPFGGREMNTALSGVSLEIGRGERVGFLGPNGAGKTTFLKLVSGLLLPSAGTIEVNGHDSLGENDGVRASCSMVMNEERSFYWRLTGVQNLEFFGVLQNLTGRLLRERIERAVEVVGLSDSAEMRVGGYSSGMKQRLAIARGLLSDSEVLILDEPTRALDPRGAEELTDLILNTLHTDLEKTLLISTHRLDEARLLCGRLCVLSRGILRADSPMNDIDASFPNLGDFYRRMTGE